MADFVRLVEDEDFAGSDVGTQKQSGDDFKKGACLGGVEKRIAQVDYGELTSCKTRRPRCLHVCFVQEGLEEVHALLKSAQLLRVQLLLVFFKLHFELAVGIVFSETMQNGL